MLKIRFRTVRATAALFVALLGAALIPAAAGAQVVVPLSVEEMAAVSDDIVHASVTESESQWYAGKLFTVHRLKVEDSLKKDRKAGSEMSAWTFGGTYGKLGSVSPGMAALQEGEEVVVFLEEPDTKRAKSLGVEVDEESPMNQLPMIVGGWQGKFKVRREVDKLVIGNKTVEQERTIVWRRTPGQPTQKSNLPSLDSFKSAVRRIAAEGTPVKTVTRNVASKQGVSVPVKDPAATALRVFDPVLDPETRNRSLVPIGRASDRTKPAAKPAGQPDQDGGK